jgi:hypothetical protein
VSIYSSDEINRTVGLIALTALQIKLVGLWWRGALHWELEMTNLTMNRRRFNMGLAAALFVAVAMPGVALAKSGVYTPAKGSGERKAIMDAMRAKGDDQDRVFVVRRLKISGNWAWLDCDPQSRDGSNRYEPESALLRNSGGKWKVVDQPCGEGDCDFDSEVSRIRHENPQAPEAIFP